MVDELAIDSEGDTVTYELLVTEKIRSEDPKAVWLIGVAIGDDKSGEVTSDVLSLIGEVEPKPDEATAVARISAVFEITLETLWIVDLATELLKPMLVISGVGEDREETAADVLPIAAENEGELKDVRVEVGVWRNKNEVKLLELEAVKVALGKTEEVVLRSWW